MQSCVDFFWYQILIEHVLFGDRNWYQFLVPVSRTGFLSVCHWHKKKKKKKKKKKTKARRQKNDDDDDDFDDNNDDDDELL